jgi:hypothetical protein
MAEADPGECALGHFCFGPVLTLGLVNPLGIGIHGRIHEQFGFAIDYQFLPSVGNDTISFGWSLFSIAGRWHPGGSAFFLSTGFAYQSFWAEGTAAVMGIDGMGNMTSIPVKAAAEAGIPAWSFGLGVMGGSGFVMGIDLALEIPLGGDIEATSSMPSNNSGNPELDEMVDNKYQMLRTDAVDAGEGVLEAIPVMFQLNLIRIGYLF